MNKLFLYLTISVLYLTLDTNEVFAGTVFSCFSQEKKDPNEILWAIVYRIGLRNSFDRKTKEKIDTAIKKAIANGANINAKENGYVGFTPLMVAVLYSDLLTFKAFLDNNADINAKDNENYTSLMFAVTQRFIEIVEILLKAGADINAKNVFGQTALFIAAANSKPDVVQMLLDAGADTNIETFAGETFHSIVNCPYKDFDTFEKERSEALKKVYKKFKARAAKKVWQATSESWPPGLAEMVADYL